jgi:hypothetical protein
MVGQERRRIRLKIWELGMRQLTENTLFMIKIKGGSQHGGRIAVALLLMAEWSFIVQEEGNKGKRILFGEK